MELVLVAGAYLLGSVSFAIVVSRVLALPDPRSYGSKNPGATNVLRTGSKLAAVLTLVGDAAKGGVAVLAAEWILGGSGNAAAARWVVPAAGLAAVVGHMYPVFHRFEGGKGVATAAGVLLALNLWLGAATLATWIAIAVFLRMSSLASLVAALFAPFYAWWLFGLSPMLPAVGVIAALLFARHRENIGRILRGEEKRIGQKASPPPAA